MVYIESWQMQCCGKPFKIGDRIEWTACKWEDDWVDPIGKIDYIYENHNVSGKALYTLIATVSEIKAQYYTTELRPSPRLNNAELPHMVYVKAIDVTEADGWDEDAEGLDFGSYMVSLVDCVIKLA